MKTSHIVILLLLAAIVVILILLISENREVRERSLTQKQFQLRYDSLEQQLKSSEQQRLLISNKLDSTNSALKTLKLEKSKTDTILIKIPGRYNRVTVDSLSKLMEYRAQNGK